MGEGRRNQHAIVFQHPADLGKGFLRLRHDVQRVGHDHHVEGLLRIGQAEHILHGKVQLCRAIIPLCLGDHLCGGVRRLDVCRRIYDVFCDQSRAGSKLQHRLVPHDRPDQLIHLVIRRPILSHKAVVTSGIFVPKVLVFTHGYLSPRVGICPAASWRIPTGRHTPGKVPRPLSHARPGNTDAP